MKSDYKTITEMAAAHGVTLRTLRFYESLKLLGPARFGLARLYTTRDEIVLRLILKGRRLGFSLSEIAKILGETASASEKSGENVDLADLLEVDQVNRQIDLLERRRLVVVGAIEELRQGIA